HGDARARGRGARVHEGHPRRAGALRRLGEAGQRRRAARPGRRRRRARRRRIARDRLLRGHLPGRYPLVALVVLDGWGCAPPGPGNAVELAGTPVFDDLWRRYPHTTIDASGEAAWSHAFTDGRDVSPTSAVADLAELPADRIATVSGRYYAMDRDGRWERTQRAFDAIVKGEGEHADDPIEAIRRSYERGVTDE